MTKTREIIKEIGRDYLQAQLGVGYKAMNRVEVNGMFPAKWSEVIKSECGERGIACPDDLFNFIRLPDEQQAAE